VTEKRRGFKLGWGREENDNRGGTTAGVVLKTIGSVARAERGKKGRGVGIRMGAGEEGRGGLVQRSVARGSRQQLPASGRERQCCFVNKGGRRGAGVANKWGRAATGPGGQWWGAG
jgi:hypothetical protein